MLRPWQQRHLALNNRAISTPPARLTEGDIPTKHYIADHADKAAGGTASMMAGDVAVVSRDGLAAFGNLGFPLMPSWPLSGTPVDALRTHGYATLNQLAYLGAGPSSPFVGTDGRSQAARGGRGEAPMAFLYFSRRGTLAQREATAAARCAAGAVSPKRSREGVMAPARVRRNGSAWCYPVLLMLVFACGPLNADSLSEEGADALADFKDAQSWLKNNDPQLDLEEADKYDARSALNSIDARLDLAHDALAKVPDADRDHPRYKKAKQWMEQFDKKIARWRRIAQGKEPKASGASDGGDDAERTDTASDDASASLSDAGKDALADFNDAQSWLKEHDPPFDLEDPDKYKARSALDSMNARLDLARDALANVPDADRDHPRYKKAKQWMDQFDKRVARWRKIARGEKKAGSREASSEDQSGSNDATRQASAKGLSDEAKDKLKEFAETREWLAKRKPPFDPQKDDTSAAISKINSAEARVDLASDTLERVPEADRDHPRYKKAKKWLEDYKSRMPKWRKQARKIDERRAKRTERRFAYKRSIPALIDIARELQGKDPASVDMGVERARKLWDRTSRLPGFIETVKNEYSDVEPEEDDVLKPSKAIEWAKRTPDILRPFVAHAAERFVERRLQKASSHIEELKSSGLVDQRTLTAARDDFQSKARKTRESIASLYDKIGEPYPADSIRKQYRKAAQAYLSAVDNAVAPPKDRPNHAAGNITKKARSYARGYSFADGSATVHRINVVDNSWRYIRDRETDVIQKRDKTVYALIHINDEPYCRTIRLTALQDHIDDDAFGDTYIDMYPKDYYKFRPVECPSRAAVDGHQRRWRGEHKRPVLAVGRLKGIGRHSVVPVGRYTGNRASISRAVALHGVGRVA